MQLPPWLAQLTGAYGIQASNGGGAMSAMNATGPGVMDGLAGIGHDMMQHFRAGMPSNPLATPGAATAPGMTTSAVQSPPAMVPPMVVSPPQAPSVPAFSSSSSAPGGTPPGQGAQGTDLASILSSIGHGVAPHIPVGVPLSKVAIHFANGG